MPVWLDAIPEKAEKVVRPNTRRWLLFLAFMMLAGIVLTLWGWTAGRTGFVFWFTALGLPFCSWGLMFGLRRFAYKAEQVGAESRNVEREALIEREIQRGQRSAWILGTLVQTPAGNKASELLKAMDRAAPLIDFSRPRGCGKPVRYAAITAFQTNMAGELKSTITRLTSRVEMIVEPLPIALSCWLMLDCDSDIYPQAEEQIKAELLRKSGRAFRLMSGKGLAAFDVWLDKQWDHPGILVAITISLPASPAEGEADAITLHVFSNRKALSYPDTLRLHRPERGTEPVLTKTLSRALLWANVQAEQLKGCWFSGPILTQGSGWNNACEANAVRFSLSEDNISIDPVLGYTGHAAPWLAVALAEEDFEQRGIQVIAVQPAAGKDDVWVTVITKEEVRKGSSGNV
ncbi:hypothetical protein [Enterobacter bugandensis]|uniref:hypothetical protein n=1 Tax=Enterobacter bugandensis TaxID=881260 RepID=UPI000B49D0AB|nr:hypothetical protein [Enterobacter bugandensis]QWZ47949.1 hypothetical protein I6L57_12110 [Enterobacter bugandensis]UBH41982.1 hypothetical protein LA316_10065 [Enterobacter bugandensis]UBH91915.1 hypothetical protein LA318_11455 [Enterobacter bugandensis]UBI00298.1 hypothetical protein LA326_09235 [Enterobacter bugandensis]